MDGAGVRGDVETPARPHSHPPYVDPSVLTFRYDRPDQIAGLETVRELGPRHAEPRKSVFVNSGALVSPPPGGVGHDGRSRVRDHVMNVAYTDGV